MIARKKSRKEMVSDLERSQAAEIAASEIVRARAGGGGPPISIRLSEALLDRLDRIAEREHRKRSNLIQHILWEFVRKEEAEGR